MKNQTSAKTPEQYIYSFYMENKHKANEKNNCITRRSSGLVSKAGWK